MLRIIGYVIGDLGLGMCLTQIIHGLVRKLEMKLFSV